MNVIVLPEKASEQALPFISAGYRLIHHNPLRPWATTCNPDEIDQYHEKHCFVSLTFRMVP